MNSSLCAKRDRTIRVAAPPCAAPRMPARTAKNASVAECFAETTPCPMGQPVAFDNHTALQSPPAGSRFCCALWLHANRAVCSKMCKLSQVCAHKALFVTLATCAGELSIRHHLRKTYLMPCVRAVKRGRLPTTPHSLRHHSKWLQTAARVVDQHASLYLQLKCNFSIDFHLLF